MSGTRRWRPPRLQLAHDEEAPAVFTLRVKLLEALSRTLTSTPIRGGGTGTWQPCRHEPWSSLSTRGRTNFDRRNPRRTSLLAAGQAQTDFTSSLPGPTQSLQASTPAPQKLLVPDLGAGTCSPFYPSLSVCAWKRGMGRSGPKSRSSLWFRVSVRVINLSSWNLCILLGFLPPPSQSSPAPSSVDAQLPRLHAHPPLWVL